MLHDQIEALLDHQPFEPFRVVMSDGSSLDVLHRQQVLLTPASLYVGVGAAPGSIIHEYLTRCPLKDIDRVESTNVSAPSSP
jgi:hypothetical protein